MFRVSPCAHPAGSLLHACEAQGAYTDCYVTEAINPASLSDFLMAFYTSGPFRTERSILKIVLGRASSDREAELLARGETESFAIWKVENRKADQILLRELTGRTKSWLMVQSAESRTHLFFGSAVESRPSSGSGSNRLGAAFHSLLWFHKLYSQILLSAARLNLERLKQ